MLSERTKSEWEVKLQSPDGKTYTEKVSSFWSPVYENISQSIGHAARCKAWLRNKKKVEFQVIGDPVLITRGCEAA